MNENRLPSVYPAMSARSFVLWGTILGAVLGASPADAGRVCGNALADGRFIVQGPLVDEFGDPCSLAVIPRSPGDFTRLILIDGAGFSDETIILSPPFAHRPRRVTAVEGADVERFRQRGQLDSPRPAPPAEPQRPFVPFTTGTIGPLTTPIGPLTTFSNTPPGIQPGRAGHH